MMEIIEKGKQMCLKKTGCEEGNYLFLHFFTILNSLFNYFNLRISNNFLGRIAELVLTREEDWPSDVTDAEKCFFQCAFKMMNMVS